MGDAVWLQERRSLSKACRAVSVGAAGRVLLASRCSAAVVPPNGGGFVWAASQMSVAWEGATSWFSDAAGIKAVLSSVARPVGKDGTEPCVRAC